MIELLSNPAIWTSLLTLTFLEIILGIDNLLFVSIAIAKLQGKDLKTARRVGIWGAMALRILLLSMVFWIVQLDQHPLFHLPDALAGMLGVTDDHARHELLEFTVKDLVLLGGGLFLLWKGTQEIHAAVEGTNHETAEAKTSLSGVVVQLMVINIVFSLDSVITAVGMTDVLFVMIAAVILSTIVMAVAADPMGRFIEEHPTMKMLALSFILLVGVALVADGAGFHIPRGYLYFAIAFSLGVELLNLRVRRKTEGRGAAPIAH